jgi:hypothetical protein
MRNGGNGKTANGRMGVNEPNWRGAALAHD